MNNIDYHQHIGSTVEWKTPLPRRISSSAFTNIRSGVLVAIIPCGKRPDSQFDFTGVKPSQCQMGGGMRGTSANDRGLIRVDRIGAKGQVLPPHYYAPRLSAITKIEGATA